MLNSHFFSVSIHWTFIFFCLKIDTILPFTQTSSFLSFYSTICTTPTFFCLHPILPFESEVVLLWRSLMTLKDKPLSFFVLNLILFYRSLKPHLFCHNSILQFVQLNPILPLTQTSSFFVIILNFLNLLFSIKHPSFFLHSAVAQKSSKTNQI